MQRILKKSSLIFSITGALLGGFLMFSSPAYGVSILPVDTLLQQAYLRQQNNDFSSMSKSLSQEGNIYDSAYKFAKKNALQAAANAFSNVANNLNSKYTCSLTPSDIGNVAANDAALNAAFA